MHVKGRVLPHQYDIKVAQISEVWRAKFIMCAKPVCDFQRLDGGTHRTIAHGEAVGLIEKQLVPARLRFQRQGEARITGNINIGNRIHLQTNA